jgi:hypothetical protein
MCAADHCERVRNAQEPEKDSRKQEKQEANYSNNTQTKTEQCLQRLPRKQKREPWEYDRNEIKHQLSPSVGCGLVRSEG